MHAGLPHDDPEESITVDGRLDINKICAKGPALKVVLNVGATYTYVPRRVFFKYKGLDLIAQGSGNYVQTVSKAEHDVQLLLKVASRLEQNKTFDEIKEVAKKTRSQNMQALPGMFNFLRKFGGQGDMTWAKTTASFIRGEVNTQRKVGPDVWDALGLDFKGLHQLPRIRHGLVCLAYTDPCPQILKPSDVKGMVNDKNMLKNTLKAEKMVCDINNIVNGAQTVFHAGVSQELSRLGMTFAASITKKKNSKAITDITTGFKISDEKLEPGHIIWLAIKRINDLDNVSAAVLDALRKYADTHAIEMEPVMHDATTSAKSTKTASNIRNTTDDATEAIMLESGWAIGDVVERKTEKDVRWIIKSFGNGKVTLEPKDADTKGVAKHANMEEFQSNEWVKKKEKDQVLIDVSAATADSSKEYLFNLIKAVGYIAIEEAKQLQENDDKCAVRLKPHKAVEVVGEIPKGKLQLAPLTENLSILEREKCRAGFDSFGPSSLFLGSFAHQSKQYCLVAAGSASYEATEKKAARRSPFWGVKTTDEESEANCKLSVSIPDLKVNVSKIHKWISNEAKTGDVIKIPSIISKQALQDGDEPTIFQPSKKQRVK